MLNCGSLSFFDWDASRPPRTAHPNRDCWHELAIVVDGTTVTYGLLQPGVYGLMKEVDDGIDYNGKTEQRRRSDARIRCSCGWAARGAARWGGTDFGIICRQRG